MRELTTVLGVRRGNDPSYDTPLKSRAEGQPTIKTRNPNINPGNVSFSWETGHPINEEENETDG